MTCALGPIVDLSRSGMSIGVQRLTGLRPGAEIDVELEAPMDSMAVKARVVRVVPTGGGRYEIALEFLGLTEADKSCVENLARHGKRKLPTAFSNEDQRAKLIEALKMPDYYAALGLTPTATIEQIQRAYRLLARKYHPDVCRDEGALQRFCLINDAHSTLGTEETRRAYDALYAMRKAA